MAKSEKKIRPKMMSKADQVRRVKLKQLKKKYCYATGGLGRRFWLGVALRRQLRSYGKRGCKKASTKRGSVWTITSTSQVTGLAPEDDNDEGEGVEDDVSEAQFEECVEQKGDSLDDDEVEGDQFPFLADETLTPLEGSRNLFPDDGGAAAPSACPLELEQFFNSVRVKPKGNQILEDIEAHVSTSNSNCHHPQLKNLVLGGSLELGTTPLILACHHGDIDWVKRIVEHWGADVNDAAVYFLYNGLYRHGHKISRATPLFVAAFNGHASIVEYLIVKGASVFSKTSSEDFEGLYDGLTPLYGALNQLSIPYERMVDVTNMVRFLLESGADPNDFPSHKPPIWMSHMCGVDVSTALVHHGLNLNQLNSDGETVLHHWVNAQPYWFDPNRKNDSFTVVKLLVDKGADIMAQNKNGFTVILAAVKTEDWKTLDYFLEKESVDRIGKIEAAEMAAAKILSKYYNNSEFERAFGYWRRALFLRQMEPGPVQKNPLILNSGKAGEWITSDELEQVINHPEEYQFQSFLVRLRICSTKSWRAISELHRDSFSFCITDLQNQGRLVDLLDLFWVTLETIHTFNYEPDDDLRSMIDNVIENLIMTLSQLEMDDPLLNAKTLKLPLEVMVAANDFLFSEDDSAISYCSCYSDHQIHPHMYLLLKLFGFLASLHHKVLDPDVRQSLRQLVLYNNLGENRRTLLHMACEDENLSTIWLLLLSGANPNAADKDGNVPLHVLADQSQYGDNDVIQSAAHFLLEYGAQLERTNDAGETAADVWIRCHDPEAGWNDPPEWCLKPVTVPTLRCLSARVVRAQNLPTNELPVDLIPFVEMRELGG